MRVDSHVHVWDLAVRDQPWTAGVPELRRSFTVADLLPLLRRHSIEAAVLVQTVCVEEETPEFLALTTTTPELGAVVGWVDLTAPDVAGRLRELQALPGGKALAGIRHQVQEEDDPAWLCRADVRRGLGAVAAAGLLYELVVRPPQLDAVLETVRALPELRFVLDHGAKPDLSAPPSPEWVDAMTSLGAAANVTAKLSGLTSEAGPGWTLSGLAPFAEVLLTAFGASRLMFGSDWPVCRLGGGYDATVSASEAFVSELGERDRARVFGETAVHVYGLGR